MVHCERKCHLQSATFKHCKLDEIMHVYGIFVVARNQDGTWFGATSLELEVWLTSAAIRNPNAFIAVRPPNVAT